MCKDAIAHFLRKHALFLPADEEERESYIEAKAVAQTEQEFAEYDLNLQRDDVFLQKILSL